MKRRISIVDYTPGTTRTVRRFAWRPTVAGTFMVWLRWYDVLQVFRIETMPGYVDGQEFVITKKYWDSIETRI